MTVGVSPNSSPAAGLIVAASPTWAEAARLYRACGLLCLPPVFPAGLQLASQGRGPLGLGALRFLRVLGSSVALKKSSMWTHWTTSFPVLCGLRGSGPSSEGESKRVPCTRSKGWSGSQRTAATQFRGPGTPRARGVPTVRRGERRQGASNQGNGGHRDNRTRGPMEKWGVVGDQRAELGAARDAVWSVLTDSF